MDRLFKMSFDHLLTYEIKRVSNLLDENNHLLASHIKTRKVFCLVDKNLQGQISTLQNYFQFHSITAHCFIQDASENKKDIQSIVDFTSFCFENHISRRDPIIAFGGGIICDVGGMAASLLRRGAPCIKIPTSLLAIVDAAVGIKNGINYADCKNSLGTFYPPAVVLIDLLFLDTLPQKEIKNGIVEMIKIISLKDRSTWNALQDTIDKLLKRNFDAQVIEVIDVSIAFMLEELSSNLLEENLERIVDYGHEFGHLIEIMANFELSHGEAVGIGMALSNNLAYKLGLMDSEHHEDFLNVFRKLNFPFWHKSLSCKKLYDEREKISRHKGGTLSIVALQKIGCPLFIRDFTFTEFEYACQVLKNLELSSASSIKRQLSSRQI